MEKTIRYFLVITIITGAIFSYGCFSDDLYDSDLPEDAKMEEMEDGDMDDEEEEMDDDMEEETEDEEEYVLAPEDFEVTPEPGIAPELNVDEIPVAEEPAAEPEPTPEPAPAAEESDPTPEPEPAVEEGPEPAVEEEAAPAEEESEPVVAEPEPAVEEPAAEPEPTTVYKDGSYSASGNYFSPAGNDPMSVSLTIENDVVTGVTITPQSTNNVSLDYQRRVKEAAPGLIVGKNLADLGSFGKINSSSLTPNGLNKAINSIKSQAAN